MKAIYASKLFRASPRKEKIRAAVENPINSELVQQLRTYLDDEYATEQYLDPDRSDNNSDLNDSSGQDNKSSNPSFHKSSTRHDTASRPADFHPSDSSELDDKDANDADLPDLNTSDDDSDEPQVKESTTVSKTSVQAQTVLYSQSSVPANELLDVVEEIKGTLNTRQDTAGVNRVLCKENSELWIYYNDNINLNNVMGPVIELLNASGYTYLDFNRLARSDNAIVFQISIADTDSGVKPLGSDESA